MNRTGCHVRLVNGGNQGNGSRGVITHVEDEWVYVRWYGYPRECGPYRAADLDFVYA